MSTIHFVENRFLILFLVQYMSIPYMGSWGREGRVFSILHIYIDPKKNAFLTNK